MADTPTPLQRTPARDELQLRRLAARRPQRRTGLRVLDVDPDLAEHLGPADAELARRHAVAAVEHLPRGTWTPPTTAPGELGLLLLDGLIVREVTVTNGCCTELLGPGDLLRPSDVRDSGYAPVASTCEWCVLEPARIAVLDRRFGLVAGRWPELVDAIVSRGMRRVGSLSVLLAISHLKRVDARLLILFWHLADRWGRVDPRGVTLRLPLTHQTLGKLIGAQRPSVTTALSDLSRAGLLAREEDGRWRLTGGAPTNVEGAIDARLARAGAGSGARTRRAAAVA